METFTVTRWSLSRLGIFFSTIADGVPECLKAVRAQLRNKAKFIKVCSSGGVGSEVDNPMHQQYTDEELKAIVNEAARWKRVVAAHCHGTDGIKAALRAGAKTLEHAMMLDEECARLMKEADAILVSTRYVLECLLKLIPSGKIPEYTANKALTMASYSERALEIAHRMGVKIALGTDSCDKLIPFGHTAEEMQYLVKFAKMTPMEAIIAGTSMGPQTLGPQAPKSGILRVGYDADIIGVSLNPLDDVSVLANHDNILLVWKSGKLVKKDGRLIDRPAKL